VARPRSAGFDGQREQILAAAARLFAERGYSAATMADVAAASGVSKATLYHYVHDKHDLLAQIAAGHVARLEALLAEVRAQRLPPEAQLRALIQRFMQAYAGAQHQHRVLTEDVRFLAPAERAAVLAAQRRVVGGYAEAVAAARPALRAAQLHTPLAMLLFGMINWTFTWLRPEGPLSHAAMGEVVAALFFGGIAAVPVGQPSAAPVAGAAGTTAALSATAPLGDAAPDRSTLKPPASRRPVRAAARAKAAQRARRDGAGSGGPA
jgi:AcrR family transcriptional regulator